MLCYFHTVARTFSRTSSSSRVRKTLSSPHIETSVTEREESTGRSGAETSGRDAPLLLKGKLQNHRIFGVGRDLCGSSSPNPCRSSSPRSALQVRIRASSRKPSCPTAPRTAGSWVGYGDLTADRTMQGRPSKLLASKPLAPRCYKTGGRF